MANQQAEPSAAPPQRAIPFAALGLLGLLGVFWGLNWPVMKIGLSEVPPFVFRAAAGVAAGLGLLAIARASGNSIAIPKAERRGLIIAAALNMSLWNILVMYGIDQMSSGRAAILAYTMPLWATLGGVIVLRENLDTRAIAALGLGLVGMGLLFFGDDQATATGPLGPALVVAAALCWGLGTVAVKHYAFTMPVTVSVGWQHLIGMVPVAAIAIAWDYRNLAPELSLMPVLAVVYNMTVTGIFCYWAYFKVVQMLPVVVSTVGTLTVPVLGVAFDAVIFAKWPGLIDYLALVAVVGAVFLVMTRRKI